MDFIYHFKHRIIIVVTSLEPNDPMLPGLALTAQQQACDMWDTLAQWKVGGVTG
jgi:hypothetical protein